MRRLVVLAAVIALGLPGQTRVDIQRQGRGTEFLAPPFAKPLRSGSSLPLTCTVNELFFLTTAAPGANIHVCHQDGQWASQGSAGLANVTVLNDGAVAGTKSAINFVPGVGLSQIVTELPTQLNVQQSLDTAVLLTKPAHQSGSSLLCASSGASPSDYACGMQPVLGSLSTGMVFHWIPDISNAGPSVSLRVNELGPTPVRLADGQTSLRPGDLRAGRMYPVWYDGTVFRVFESPLLNDYQTVSGGRSGAALFCDATSSVAGAYECSLNPPLASHLPGMVLHWRPSVSSTGTPLTLKIGALTPLPIKRADGLTDPAPGEVQGGHLYQIWNDGSLFRILDFVPQNLVTRAQLQSGEALLCPSTSSVGLDFACALQPALAAYSTGLLLHWVPDVSATGEPASLNVNALGAVPIKRSNGLADPVAGDFTTGQVRQIWFDGSSFRIINTLPIPQGTGTAPACTAEARGLLWFTTGEAGVADSLAVCAKDAADAYDWRSLYE